MALSVKIVEHNVRHLKQVKIEALVKIQQCLMLSHVS